MPDDDIAQSDQDIVRLAQAEQEAGVPDIQTAQAAADAKHRMDGEGESESAAHPS